MVVSTVSRKRDTRFRSRPPYTSSANPRSVSLKLCGDHRRHAIRAIDTCQNDTALRLGRDGRLDVQIQRSIALIALQEHLDVWVSRSNEVGLDLVARLTVVARELRVAVDEADADLRQVGRLAGALIVDL